jgi:hypothetical protein
VREITDSFMLSAEMDSSSALDNPAVARLIRTVVSRFQKAGAVVNPSSRLERYASLFDTDPPTDDASRQWALDTALLETLQFVAVSEAFGDGLLPQLAGDLSVAAGGSIDANIGGSRDVRRMSRDRSYPSAKLMMRPTARTSRSQRPVSLIRERRPTGVRR